MKAVIGIISILILGVSEMNSLYGQDKAPVRIYLEHFRSAEKYQLSVRVLTKKDKRYRPASGIEVALYTSKISNTNLLGTIVTIQNGTGNYTFNQEQFESAKNNKIVTYIAMISETDSLQKKETAITIKKVNFEVRFVVKDSVKIIHAKVSEIDSTGSASPREDVEIKFLVERPLSPLPIGDDFNTTDEDGNVSMEFPVDLPGDEEGFVKILVRIVESEDFGIVEVSTVKQWGIAIISNNTSKRSLWASGANAPILLLIFINTLIAVVWGMIFYMIYKIFLIRKIGQNLDQNS